MPVNFKMDVIHNSQIVIHLLMLKNRSANNMNKLMYTSTKLWVLIVVNKSLENDWPIFHVDIYQFNDSVTHTISNFTIFLEFYWM